MKLNKLFILLFLISFIEGGLVMALELISAKLFSPYFGGSIYVWSALLSVSLGGLALGYFVGGKLATKNSLETNTLFLVILLGILSLVPIVFLNSFVLNLFIEVNLKLAVLVCSLLFIFLPMVFFGAVSPLIIKTINNNGVMVGKSSAYIYTISTFGGVCFTLIFGFYFIPYSGLQTSLIIVFSLLSALVLVSRITLPLSK